MIRLSNQRWEMSRIAGYVGCHVRTVGAALNTWVSRRFEGLAGRPQKGNRRKLHKEALQFMQDKLAEDRCWNARQLTVAGQPDPQSLQQAKAALDTLKRGRSKVG